MHAVRVSISQRRLGVLTALGIATVSAALGLVVVTDPAPARSEAIAGPGSGSRPADAARVIDHGRIAFVVRMKNFRIEHDPPNDVRNDALYAGRYVTADKPLSTLFDREMNKRAKGKALARAESKCTKAARGNLKGFGTEIVVTADPTGNILGFGVPTKRGFWRAEGTSAEPLQRVVAGEPDDVRSKVIVAQKRRGEEPEEFRMGLKCLFENGSARYPDYNAF